MQTGETAGGGGVHDVPRAAGVVAERFPGELTMSFDEAMRAVEAAPASPATGEAPWPPFRRRKPPVSERGTIPRDGFMGDAFEEKMERERRYGEVYSFDERAGGYVLRVEFPRRVPPSATKEQLRVPDTMPDYAFRLALRNGFIEVHAHVTDPMVRKVAAFSPAFPPDFTTRLAVPAPVRGFAYRYANKTLEVVLLKS